VIGTFGGRLVSRLAVVALALVAATASLSAQRINTDRGRLAVKGYDVVAYFVDGRAVEGTQAFEHEVGGARYRFASAANRDRFASDPQRYVPQYGGFCAWAVSRGYTADTDPLAWKIVDGRLFLNYDRRVQRTWEGDVSGNVKKADGNWPALSRR
jgi:YHS domain-containing protein